MSCYRAWLHMVVIYLTDLVRNTSHDLIKVCELRIGLLLALTNGIWYILAADFYRVWMYVDEYLIILNFVWLKFSRSQRESPNILIKQPKSSSDLTEPLQASCPNRVL